MQQRGKLEVTHHRRRVKTGGLPGATSREAPIPSTPETSRPEEELSGLGVSPVKFTGTVAGRPVDVMIDSGSAEDFISLKAAERLGMRKVPFSSDTSVWLADGSKLALSWKTSVFNYGLANTVSVFNSTDCRSKDMRSSLGRPWLHKRHPAIDWRTDTVAFPRRGETVTLEAKVVRGPDEGRLISGLQTNVPQGKGTLTGPHAMARRGGATGGAPVLCGCRH